MKKIKLEYVEHGRPKFHTTEIPETLSEATGQQFTALLALSLGRIAEEPFLLTFFDIQEPLLAQLDLWQLYVLTEQLRDIWKVSKIDHFPIEKIEIPSDKKCPAITLHAPLPQLRGMTFQQFMTVDQMYQWYAYTGKKQYLYSMIAALYTVSDTVFGLQDIDYISRRLQSYPDAWLFEGLAFNWAMVRVWLAEAYPYLFPTSEEGNDDKKARGVKQRPSSWLNIFDTLVGDDLTRIESYKTLACMDVIRILNKRIKKQNKKSWL